MRRGTPGTWLRMVLYLVAVVVGIWWEVPFFIVFGVGFAASALVSDRRRKAVVGSLTFVGVGAATLVDVVRSPFDVGTAFGVLAGACLSGMGAFFLWRVRRVPRS